VFSPPTELDTLQSDLFVVENELSQIYNKEGFKAFLGEAMPKTQSNKKSRKDELIQRRSEIITRIAELG
jgi:hypothetical protein